MSAILWILLVWVSLHWFTAELNNFRAQDKLDKILEELRRK